MPALAIEELWLSHFRSHRATRLTLDGRPVALFGPNGAGKTNVLEAISLLSPGRGLRRATPDEIARRPESLGWKITAQLRNGTRRHEIETRAEPGSPRSLRIDGKTAPQAALGHVARILWLVPAMDRLWTEGAEGRRRFLDRITLSFDPGHGDAVLAYDKAMRERNRLLRDQVRDDGWYSALEAQMARAGAAIMASRAAALRRIAEASAAHATPFPAASLSIAGPDGAGEEPLDAASLGAALAAGRPRDLAAGRCLTGPHRADMHAVYPAKGLAAAQCSTGEQKALLISLVLANARALAEDMGMAPILLLDEVAAHLDADRRAALYGEILSLDTQAFMTGTGPELFAPLGDAAQGLAVSEREGCTTLAPARAG